MIEKNWYGAIRKSNSKTIRKIPNSGFFSNGSVITILFNSSISEVETRSY